MGGELVDEEALYQALSEGRLGGAGLDVFAQEPPDPSLPVYQLPNVFTMPHPAGSTDGTARKRAQFAAANLDRYARGEALEGQIAAKLTNRLSKNKIGELSKANVSICIGTAELSVQAVLDIEKEAFIELDGAPNDPGELYVNGDLVARGEVVTVGSDFGMRIAEVIS